jgi:hypothetical protein
MGLGRYKRISGGPPCSHTLYPTRFASMYRDAASCTTHYVSPLHHTQTPSTRATSVARNTLQRIAEDTCPGPVALSPYTLAPSLCPSVNTHSLPILTSTQIDTNLPPASPTPTRACACAHPPMRAHPSTRVMSPPPYTPRMHPRSRDSPFLPLYTLPPLPSLHTHLEGTTSGLCSDLLVRSAPAAHITQSYCQSFLFLQEQINGIITESSTADGFGSIPQQGHPRLERRRNEGGRKGLGSQERQGLGPFVSDLVPCRSHAHLHTSVPARPSPRLLVYSACACSCTYSPSLTLTQVCSVGYLPHLTT